jgi:transposase
MMNYREIIRLKSLDYSNTSVGASIGSSRNKVAEIWKLAQERNLGWPIPETLTNKDLESILFPDRAQKDNRQLPDFEYIYNELAKPNVTLTLLWAEYCVKCEAGHVIPYQHTQFNEKYHAYAASKRATLRIKRKPGESMEVDWAGSTLTVWDNLSGEPHPAYVFVACLPCSLYSYAEATPDMKTSHWIQTHIHAYHYFGGVARILTPDNLKTGVIKNTHSELVLNRTYQEMAEYYGTAIIPARPVSPKDKPNAEGTVGVISTWIIAALRNQKFFSFDELNVAIQQKLNEFNDRPFQKKKGSRLSAFEEEEKNFLMPLPASPYETAVWSTATIQPDYLITVGNCKYSVPYELIGREVEIRATEKCVEVFYQNNRVASHARLTYSPDPIYNPEHMPENHRKYLNYNEESFRQWAEDIGQHTLAVVKTFLYSHKVPQQGYKSCSSLMKLADKYTPARLEAACQKALSYTPNPSLKNITTILTNGQDKVKPQKPPCTDGSYGITRRTANKKGGEQ